MRARGVPWVFLVACVVAGACGSDHKSPSNADAVGGDGEPSGGGSKPTGGSNNEGGAGNRGGSAGNVSGTNHGGAGPVEMGGAGMAGDGGSVDVPGPKAIHFDVVSSQDAHAISPLIYGANIDGLDCADSKARFTFCRPRSAAWSTYNWENNASNAGASDCNENNAALSASDSPAAAITDVIDVADAVMATTVVTVPMLGHVALDKNAGSAAPACSGDVSKTANYLNTRFAQNRATKGAALSLVPDTADGFVNQDELIAFLKDGYPDSSLLFSLDTQPELWFNEHPKLQAAKLSYADEIDLSAEYAKMIKTTWPGSQVVGLVGYGYLAAVNLQESPDYDTYGEFYGYFLKQMADASDKAGVRLLDYVDLHWFPEIYVDNNRIIGDAANEADVLARVQAPRSLWDPDFVESSWITGANGNVPLELLAWLQGSIDDNYPGTKLAISEWAYGGGNDVSGAIAAADALGIFGQRGVDLAGVVSFSPDTEPYLIGAFEAFRNYDGQDHGFGDTSVSASSSDVPRGSIYASIDQADPSRMVLVAINRYGYELDATLSIEHDTSYASITPYLISDGHPDPVAGDPIDATEPNAFQMTLPPYSVTVLVPSE
jgi:hypothetical protein